MQAHDYDLVVIGSGPAGHRAAIQAAKLGKRVAIIEKKSVVGGVCINTGTIPSKTLREAALRLSGYRDRSIYGRSYSAKPHITMRDLLFRVDQVISNELDVARHQLLRNNVDVMMARASFVDPHRLELELVEERVTQHLTATHIVIAVGTTTACEPNVRRVLQNRGVRWRQPTRQLGWPWFWRQGAGRYGTGLGCVFQISAAYSRIVRSLEKRPEHATLMIAFSAHRAGSA